jgi:DNA-directed RNA polymerase subunit RPC12/RpoP
MDMQLEKHFKEEEMSEEVSTCCGAEIEFKAEDDYRCSKCDGKCLVITREEYETSRYESAMEDKADAERELRREDD